MLDRRRFLTAPGTAGAVLAMRPALGRPAEGRREQGTRPADAVPGVDHMTEIAKRLAALMGFAYAGEYDPSDACFGRVYFVPSDTFLVLILQDQDVLGYGMLVQYPAWGVY
ncbi:hypothetical protein AA309_07285 [Microvirga vignae]|uniref:Uncharacterized protein n=1 Tax=Microvirga vignae TaxID=1225564 RepID=A0A0H1RFF8_9HYPH|nr:hypothetical protein [Microvirga vignae]KLK93809.1 hypothetical protein AA309_07285 [Microvirga vignae]